MDLEKDVVTQPCDRRWDDSSDHTPLIYKIKSTNVNLGKVRISKDMLNNKNNMEVSGENYREHIPALIARVKQTKAATAEEVYKELARHIIKPWTKTAKRRPQTRSSHRNAS